MKYISIDPGVTNFGMLGATVNNEVYRDELLLCEEITLCVKLDLTELIKECDCSLGHEKLVCDYIAHLFALYRTEFESCDTIVMERQMPNGGVVSVQELIMQAYRNKCVLVPTASLHVFCGIRHLDYDGRKEATVSIASEYLSGEKEFMFWERKHDMADALCVLLYHLSRTRKPAPRIETAFSTYIKKYYYVTQ